jgi:hypothetical protein
LKIQQVERATNERLQESAMTLNLTRHRCITLAYDCPKFLVPRFVGSFTFLTAHSLSPLLLFIWFFKIKDARTSE